MFYLFSSFPLLLAFVVGGLGFGFQFCVFVDGWRHALRSEWPFTIIIDMLSSPAPPSRLCLSLFVCRGRRYALQE